MDRGEALDLARTWWSAVAEISDVSVSSTEMESRLAEHLEKLAAALASEPFDPSPGATVGAALVRANLTNPLVLARSSTILARLPEMSGQSDRHGRLAAVLGQLGCGFSAELFQLATTTRQSIEARFWAVFAGAPVAIAICDAAGQVLEANPALVKMLGADPTMTAKPSVFDLTHPGDHAEIDALIAGKFDPVLLDPTWHERRFRRMDGTYGWAQWASTAVPGSGGRETYLFAFGEDTTERRALQATLRRQALHDPLTGLPNRRYLLDTLQSIIARAGTEDPAGLCFADLDGFKQFNDRYGHGVGDQLLAAVAARLDRSMPGPSCLLARIGGDEFVALIAPPCDDDRVATVAESMLAALAEPIRIDNLAPLRMSVSIGAVVTNVAGADAEALLDRADAGLYRAKADGKGRWVLHHMKKGR